MASSSRLNEGVREHQSGRLAAAESIYREVLASSPENPDALHLLGLVLHQTRQDPQGVELIRRAIELNSNRAEFHANLGNIYQAQGQLDRAAACFQRSLEIKPQLADPHFQLGTIHYAQGKPQPAAASLRRAVQLKPDWAEAHFHLGIALTSVGELQAAIASYRRAIECNPDYAEAYTNLGAALLNTGQLEEAVRKLQEALRLKPALDGAHTNLGIAYQNLGKLDDAADSFQRALQLNPRDPQACSNLSQVLSRLGKLEEALGIYLHAMQLAPENARFHCSLLVCSQYLPDMTEAALLASHRSWDDQHASRFRSDWPTFSSAHHVELPLKIGFVSGDLGDHPVTFFLVRFLESLNSDEVQAFCYSTRARGDAMSTRVTQAVHLFRDVSQLSDESFANLVREDAIDILIDLSGPTADNRLLTFARKPAPLQATWIGYPGTTGMTAMDYLICDRFCVPPGSEQYYAERILRLPDGLACYDPPADAPAVGPLPAEKNGHITFGSFNKTNKVTPQVVSTWSEILRRLPTAKLVLKHAGFGDTRARNRYGALFVGHGVDLSRVEFRGRTNSRFDTWQQYHDLDLALDPFPYGGATTTCEALWLGVPVISFPGDTFASRVSQSHLVNAGLSEMVAPDRAHYVDLAVEMAQDTDRLAALRAGLRDQVASSPLCDGPRLAKNFTRAMQQIWTDRC